MSAPTSEELTRAFVLALKGDCKMTPEEREFVRDVIRRDVTEQARRELQFLNTVLRP